MINLKNVTNLPLVESAEGLNLIVNDNGAAKQIAASAVGAQADWAETNESSPAFIKNKPNIDNNNKEFDVEIKAIYEYGYVSSHTIQYLNDFENIKNKFFEAGISPKAIIKAFIPHSENSSMYEIVFMESFETYYAPENYVDEGSSEKIYFSFNGRDGDHSICLEPDGKLLYDYPQSMPR